MRVRRTAAKAALGLAVALLATMGVTQGVASANHVRRCGDVITANEVLHNDIGPCHEDGLIVSASNITLDLNGHTIFGEGGQVVVHQAAGVRILNQTNVVVKNGVIRDFYHGVRVTQGGNNLVTQLRTINNQGGNGVVLENSRDNVVEGNTVIGNGRFSGVSTFDSVFLPPASARNTFRNNVLNMNNFSGAHGISLENGPGHRVLSNIVVASGRDGISLFGRVSDATIENNLVRNNGRHGINVASGSTGNLIRGNQATGNAQVGIQISGQSNRILANSAFSNAVADLRDSNGGGTCDANVWSGNAYGTATPDCTKA